VIRVQNEQQIERLGRDGVDLIGLARHGEQHLQHVAAVVEVVAWVDERLAKRMLVCCGGDCGDLRDDTVGEDLAMARIIDIHRVVIERRHRRNHRRHHRHRVRVVMEPVEEAQQRLVDHRVISDVAGELLQLLAAGKLSEKHEIRYFHERALLGELLHRIASVQKHSGIAVDVRDLAVGGRCETESRVVSEDAEVPIDRGNVDYGGSDGAGADRELRLALRSSIDELELFLGHCGEILKGARAGPNEQSRRLSGTNTGSVRRNQECRGYSTILTASPDLGSRFG